MPAFTHTRARETRARVYDLPATMRSAANNPHSLKQPLSSRVGHSALTARRSRAEVVSSGGVLSPLAKRRSPSENK